MQCVSSSDQPAPTQSAVHAVLDAAHRYEAALVSGDTSAAAAWFHLDGTVSRFGPEGAQLTADAVGAVRASTTPLAAPAWIVDEVRPLADDLALHLAVLQRGDVEIQRTQVWRRTDSGWRIVHAHVSRRP